MKISQKLISLPKIIHGIHKQVNIQKKRFCQIIKVKSVSLMQQGDHYMSMQLSLSHWFIMSLMLWISAFEQSAKIQISIVLINMVRKPSMEPIVLALRWGITPVIAQKTIKGTITERNWDYAPPFICKSIQSKQQTIIIILHILYFQT